MGYEYKVVPTQERRKLRDKDGQRLGLAETLQDTLNDTATEGWEFYRTESLPVTKRTGETEWRSVLVFRRDTGAMKGAEPSTMPGAMPMLVLSNPVRDTANRSKAPQTQRTAPIKTKGVNEPEPVHAPVTKPVQLEQDVDRNRLAHLQLLRSNIDEGIDISASTDAIPAVLADRAMRMKSDA